MVISPVNLGHQVVDPSHSLPLQDIGIKHIIIGCTCAGFRPPAVGGPVSPDAKRTNPKLNPWFLLFDSLPEPLYNAIHVVPRAHLFPVGIIGSPEGTEVGVIRYGSIPDPVGV